jgi:lysophospholipase L1-like esterase
MKRRNVVAAVAAAVMVAACGGGGGGGGGSSGPTGAALGGGWDMQPVGVNNSTAPIAMWGDSLIEPVAIAMDQLVPERDVYNGGVGGETSQQIAARQAADFSQRGAVNVFWYGHNNMRVDFRTAPAQIKADLAASIARLDPGNDRYVVLSVVNNATEGRAGTAEYDTIMQLNRELAATYPNNFLDIRRFMVEQYDPNNPDQVADRALDLPSTSLRFDEIHLTGYGADIVARRIKNYLDVKGW